MADLVSIGNISTGQPVLAPAEHAHIHAGIDDELLAWVLSQVMQHDTPAQSLLTGNIDTLLQTIYDGSQFKLQFLVPEEISPEGGMSYCVEVPRDAELVYAYRPHRRIPSQLWLKGKPVATRNINVILQPWNKGEYRLMTIYWGPLAPREPADRWLKPEHRDETLKFWETHALVLEPGVSKSDLEPATRKQWLGEV